MKLEVLFVAALFAGAIGAPRGAVAAQNNARSPVLPTARRLPDEGAIPSLRGAAEWINSASLTADSLRGKVVLVDFWTYSCINWQRTLPYVRAWAEKYKDADRYSTNASKGVETVADAILSAISGASAQKSLDNAELAALQKLGKSSDEARESYKILRTEAGGPARTYRSLIAASKHVVADRD